MGTVASKDQHKKYRKKIRSIGSRASSSFDSVTSVNLIKHQVVLSDYVQPISSLTASISIPRRSSWKKRYDDTSIASSSCFEDDAVSSPRTSLGSDDDHQKKKSISNTIVLESKYNVDITPEEITRPFWAYHIGDEKEYDRQLRQHYVLKHIFKGNLHVPITPDKPLTILDSACGAGFWAFDVATSYPQTKVIGLDTFPLEEKRLKGHTSVTVCAPNIIYKHGDLLCHLTLPDNYFDIIYQRDVIAILPYKRWSFLFDDYYRLLKEGGSIEIVEHDFNIRDPGPVLTLMNEWYKTASMSVGINPRETENLQGLLEASGFKHVEKRVVSIPVGEWPTDKAEKENGFLYKQLVGALFRSMRSWWTMELGVSEEEYNKVICAAMNEFEEQCCYMNWFIYTAKKI